MQVLSMMNHPNYLYRMTVLSTVAALASNVPRDILCNAMVPVIVNCAKVGIVCNHFFSFVLWPKTNISLLISIIMPSRIEFPTFDSM